MSKNARYLMSIKKEQDLKEELERTRNILKLAELKLSDVKSVKSWLIERNLPVDKKIEEALNGELNSLSIQIETLKEEEYALYSEWTTLREQNNSGNVRHFIYTLYTEQGLSISQFARLIRCAEEDITRLIKEGVINENLFNLLERICFFFNIKVPDSATETFLTQLSRWK